MSTIDSVPQSKTREKLGIHVLRYFLASSGGIILTMLELCSRLARLMAQH